MKTHNPAHIAAFPPELPPTRRYTLNGDPGAEGQVQQDLARLAADADGELRPELVALILVGRFARGEGGFIRRAGEPLARPSYRCLAVLEPMSARAERRAEELGKLWTEQLEVPVHIHVHDRAALRRARPTLWWLDVARGNAEVLCGDRHALQDLRARDVGELDADEAGWLMTRAAADLALAWAAPDPDPNNVNHQLHLLALACGDATLLLSRRFGATLRSRETQLAGLGVHTDRVSAYHEAAAYLGTPEGGLTPSLDALAARTRLIGRFHLETEHARRGAPTDLDGFLRSRRRLYTSPQVRLLKPGSWLGLLTPQETSYPYVGAPEERLARAAAGLAYGHQDPSLRLLAARLLGTRGRRSGDDLASALRRLRDQVAQANHADAVPAGFYD